LRCEFRLFHELKMSFFRREPAPASAWCLVGNIAENTSHGEGGSDKQIGTKHFSPRTKVYCLPPQWGDGYEDIKVIGRHRGSKQFVTLTMPARHVTNWRAKVVYDPEVLRRLAEHGNYHWESRQAVEETTVMLQTRERLGKNCTSANIEAAIKDYTRARRPWWRFW
jgi:hypothetical protein